MNTNEKRLLIGLLVLLLGGLGYLGFDQLSGWKRKLDEKARKLGSERSFAQELLAQEKRWQARSAWLTESQPPFSNRKDAELALVNLITDSAKEHDVTILKNQPSEPLDLEDMVAATMLVDAKADMEKMMAWLHDLQKPLSFLSLPAVRLMPDQEDTSKVLITFSLQKWFRKTQS